ncbi:MAG: glycosyltransferase [Terracidiphilus sp.]|jgi:glycosyltransferase involved in cell wall biosynthesis
MSSSTNSEPKTCSQNGWDSTRYPNPYLLVVGQHLPIYVTESGQLFTDELWQKDLAMHLVYLDHLMIATPLLHEEPPANAVLLESKLSRVEVIALPAQASFRSAIRTMPTTLFRLWRATRRAGIVHSGIAGWPIPMGWLVTPIVLLCKKPFVVIVESAPWRLQNGVAAGWKKRLRASLQEFMGRWVLSKTELPIFTQDEYRQSLMGQRASRGHVIPASWIDEQDILTKAEAVQVWQNKLANPDSRLKILFVGRLVPNKGILVLLEALRQLSAGDAPIVLSILGEGDLKSECMTVASELAGVTSVSVLGIVPYGAPLFALIREYDALVVPTISDEQPRIVFDAYSQAVPALASDTAGLRSCVRNGETGLLATANDVTALVALLQYALQNRSELKSLGLQSLKYAHEMTHQEMHRRRVSLLKDMLEAHARRMGI